MLYFLIFLFATFSLVYELLLWTISSYLVGDSILQFSLTIGLFLFGLWIGSYLSKFSKNHIRNLFIWELVLWFVGWFSVFFIKFLYIYFFSFFSIFYIFYIFIVIFIGFLTWLEVPLIANIINEQKKINQQKGKFSNIISDVFTYDYVGALFATFLFPFILLPRLGLTNSSLLLWSLNILIVLLFLHFPLIKQNIWKKATKFTLIWIFVLIVYVICGFFINQNLDKLRNRFFYKDPIIFEKQSKYQDIVITKNGQDARLYLDGKLQFSSLDEKRYHEALWDFPANKIKTEEKQLRNILILWGGDWLLARNVINSFSKNQKYQIDLVDLDPVITEQAKENTFLKTLNEGSFSNKNIQIKNEDAFSFLLNNEQKYDIIVADFPDPRDIPLSKLYSQEFYNKIFSSLIADGLFVTQGGNAFFANKSFWCIDKTLQSVFGSWNTIAYHAYIPTFWDWWFVLAHKTNKIPQSTNKLLQFEFDKDYFEDAENIQINTLDNPKIIEYYLQGRKKFNL